MKEKKLIIMLSTYNGEKYIDQQISSIFNQNINMDIALFVRDDGSTDNTKKMIEAWGDRLDISWCKTTGNLGPGKSFWELLKQAPEADYYAFADQDDYWYENKLSRALSFFDESPTPQLYFSNSRLVDENLSPLGDTTYNNPDAIKLTIRSQLITGTCQGCTMVFNSQLRDKLIKMSAEHMIMHDLSVIVYSIVYGKIYYDNLPSLDYRQHESNVESPVNKGTRSLLKQAYKRWIKNRGEISLHAKEIISNCKNDLSPEDYLFCNCLCNYKRNLKSKIYLLKHIDGISYSKLAERSFKVRLIFNLI